MEENGKKEERKEGRKDISVKIITHFSNPFSCFPFFTSIWQKGKQSFLGIKGPLHATWISQRETHVSRSTVKSLLNLNLLKIAEPTAYYYFVLK